jgi:hypothetical protein
MTYQRLWFRVWKDKWISSSRRMATTPTGQALYFVLYCLASDQDETQGRLVNPDGIPLTRDQIRRLSGFGARDFRRGLQSLLESGLVEIENDVISIAGFSSLQAPGLSSQKTLRRHYGDTAETLRRHHGDIKTTEALGLTPRDCSESSRNPGQNRGGEVEVEVEVEEKTESKAAPPPFFEQPEHANLKTQCQRLEEYLQGASDFNPWSWTVGAVRRKLPIGKAEEILDRLWRDRDQIGDWEAYSYTALREATRDHCAETSRLRNEEYKRGPIKISHILKAGGAA